MASGLELSVHVEDAKIVSTSDVELVAIATVGDQSKSTAKRSSTRPIWNEDLEFHVKVLGALRVELLISSSMKRQLLGFTSIPLYSVRHSTKHARGSWMTLHSRSVSGELVATGNAIRLDAFFKLPKDIPPNELQLLEEKLKSFSSILEQESLVLDQQRAQMVKKQLPLPTSGRGSYEYPNLPRSRSMGLPQPAAVCRLHVPLHSSNTLPFSRSSSGTSTKSEDSRGTPSVAKERWRSAVSHPKFQNKIMEMMKEKRPNKGFNPAILELVSQLQGIEQGGSSRKRATSSNAKANISAMNRIRSKLNRKKSKEQLMVAKHTINEDMRIHVYKTALSVLIYPVSDLHHHQFEDKTFKSPTYCQECEGFIYGMMKQGYQCKRCGKTCHKRCVTSARPDCFHIKSTNTTYAESLLTAITNAMETTLLESKSIFFLMREAFNVDDIENKTLIDDASKTIKHLARNFSANVSIKVIAAQGLATHTLSDNINLYVSVDLGGVKKRTKSHKSTTNPSWNEEFKFDCTNMVEPIKIRVWNERHNTWGKLSQKLTSEGDMFLGQKVIEVMTLGAAQDIWYTLGKRTDDNLVSGSIKLNVSCVVAGEFHAASFHQMYTLIHEQLFLYEHIKELKDIASLTEKVQSGDHSEVKFFNSEAQTILDRYATRYAIESVFRIMVHMKLLIDHSTYIPHAYGVLITALELIKARLIEFAAVQNSILGAGMQKMMLEVFLACNFGKDNFSRCIDKLLTQLKVEMQQYRIVYPVDDKQRLKDFENNCKLMHCILEMQRQIMGTHSQHSKKLNEILKSCMTECITQTFDDIIQQNIPENLEGHPGLNKNEKPYEFFYSLLDGMESMEHEDRTIYQPLVEQHCDFVLGKLVALTVWDLFKDTIQELYQVPENLTVFPPMEAIHLLFTVKEYYEKHVYPSFPKGNLPDLDYPHWFKPAVILWIQDFQKKTQEVIKNAWTIDKASNFEAQNDQKFSSSSFDMIDYFHKGQQVIKKFDEGVVELRHAYNHAYALVIKSTIVQYCDMVSSELTNQNDLLLTSMLVNNIQFLRHGVETLYNVMGGELDAGEQCTEELKELQGVLSKQVNTWCKYIGMSVKDSIWEGIQLVQLEIINVKSAGPVTKSDCKFDKVLSRLFEYCKAFRECCEEKVVLPKMINRVWLIVVKGLHNMLLPPVTGIAREETEDVGGVVFVTHSYSSKQCSVVDKLLDYLKDFFQDDSLGVKAHTLSSSIKQLKVFTKLYSQTTDALISEFIKDFAAKARYDECRSSGEVSLEVSAFRHPATGEFDGNIRIISARDLQGFHDVQVLKPNIDLHLVVPGLTAKYKYTASTKDTSSSPAFNQTFKFVLPPNNLCELAITAKHKTMLGGTKIIGVAVVPLKTALQSDMHTIDLNHSLPLTEYGRVLLTVLAQRPHDEKAKEFVELKTQSRSK